MSTHTQTVDAYLGGFRRTDRDLAMCDVLDMRDGKICKLVSYIMPE